MNNRACKMLLFAICATLLHAGPAGRENDQQKLAEAAGLARQHRFLEADRAIQGVSVPPDLTQAIAFHRLRAAIDAGADMVIGHHPHVTQPMSRSLRYAGGPRA